MKILVIGESCTDFFIYGKTERLSPEAPVPVFVPIYTNENKGMAGNVVQNIKAISTETTVDFLHQVNKITKTRYVENKSNHMFLRVDEGERDVNELYLNELQIKKLKEYDAVIISDYDKGFLNEDTIKFIADNSKLTVLDSKKKLSKDTINKITFVKLNEYEFENNKTDDENLLNKMIITLGRSGAKHMNIEYPSPSPRDTIDVSGAGDTFTASFTIKYIQTNDIAESIRFANSMASLVVMRRGVATP